MVKGFKDGKGAFHPISQPKGVRSRRDTSQKIEGVKIEPKIRKQRELLNEIPDDYDWETHGEHPQPFTDEAYRRHTEKHRAIANMLYGEIQEETPTIIQTVEGLKGYHEDAVRDADDLIRSLRNKNRSDGNTLPLEYMDLSNTEIDNFIRDWSNVASNGEQFNREQNQAIAKDLEDLRNFQNKLEKYHHSHGMVS